MSKQYTYHKEGHKVVDEQGNEYLCHESCKWEDGDAKELYRDLSLQCRNKDCDCRHISHCNGPYVAYPFERVTIKSPLPQEREDDDKVWDEFFLMADDFNITELKQHFTIQRKQ